MAEPGPTSGFARRLLESFAAHSARTAVEHRGHSIRYGALESRARRAAGWLQAQGLEPGDRVALVTPDKWPLLQAHLGVLLAGGVSLPLNPHYTQAELRYFLADSGAKLVVAGSEAAETIRPLQNDLPDLTAVLEVDADWEPPQAPLREPNYQASDRALVIYSSGTTGQPKGVVHDHANLAVALEALAETWRVTPDDRVICALPLFHIHGLSFATQLSLLCGACLVLEESFHPRRTLDALARGTVFMGVPPFYYAWLERPEFVEAARQWQHVRLFTCGSAPIRADVLPRLESILGRPIINRYGMTEAHVLTSLPLDGPWPHGSVGVSLPGVELRIVDDQGAALANDTCSAASAGDPRTGHVQVRGAQLFCEYWRRPDATREAWASGWFDTGDIGWLDRDGFLKLVGRQHDLIISSGFNVYPQVVESVLNTCPGVAEAAVFGLPDERRGERVAAAIVRSDGTLDEARLREFLRTRLVDYQRPSVWLFVDELPRNALGKVARAKLRELAG
ncbi:MAG: acyl--CoA ligase [Pirellulales bacterium]|nr:acyl--CoA ligase [Pirellulales bacterium]